MDDRSESSVADRLERLERAQRRQRRVGMLALVGLAAVTLMGQAGMTIPTILETKTLEAERIVLKDSKGNLRVLVSVSDEGVAGFALVSEDGKATVLLAATPNDGGQLFLADARGVTRVELGQTPSQPPGQAPGQAKEEWALLFRDGREKPRARLGVGAERSQVELFGPGGQRWAAAAPPSRPAPARLTPPRPAGPPAAAPSRPPPVPAPRPSRGVVPPSER